MSLKNLTKAKLVEMAHQLELSDIGTKVVLEERITEHFDNHPELEEDSEFKKFVVFRKRNSPVKSTHVDDISSSPSKAIPTLDERITSSPGGLLTLGSRIKAVFSSPSKSDKNTEDAEDEDEDDETDEGEDSDIEVLSVAKAKGDGDDLEEENGEPAPGIAETVKEWFTEQSEKVQDWYDDSADWVVYQSNATKKFLSTAETVNLITTASEAATVLKSEIPLVKLKDITYLDQKILSKYTNYIDLNFKVPDVTAFFQLNVALVLISWLALAVIIPIAGSFYFNFIGKKQKKVKFDPLAFNLIKLILAYFFLSGHVSFDDLKADTKVWAEEHGFSDSATFFDKVRHFSTHNQITLNLLLGNLPFLNGFIGVLVALYIAAI